MKLLVTTDFSTNSKGAIRFVQMLAKQSKEVEVIFYHSVQFLQPSLWSEDTFENYKRIELKRLHDELKKFVLSVVGNDIRKFADYKIVVEPGVLAGNDIVHYAENRKVDFICLATQGAGILRKILGTHTSYIINHSKVPVLAIPSRYRAKAIKRVTYISDFENVKVELDTSLKFTSPIKAELEVLHFTSALEEAKSLESNKNIFKTKEYKKVSLNLLKTNYEKSLVDRVAQFVSKSKPEVLVMFTKKERSFFERIFLPSKSAELTFNTRVPVLIYSK